MAASKAGPEHRPPRPEKPQIEKPPLEGVTNLREALASITVPHPSYAEATEGKHAPDLKNTLQQVAPKAAEAKPPPRELGRPMPASLPERELRAMLEVDTPEDEKNSS